MAIHAPRRPGRGAAAEGCLQARCRRSRSPAAGVTRRGSGLHGRDTGVVARVAAGNATCRVVERGVSEEDLMVHRHVSGKDPEADAVVAPAYTHRLDLEPIPKYRMPERGAGPEAVYRLIHDELLLDGSSRLNLATFVTTWMEPEADRLMAEAFDKNMIDKDEYPQTAEIERRCVNMVAHLFNAPERGAAIGASTIGSSEAVMLAGLAMKWRWRTRSAAAGMP